MNVVDSTSLLVELLGVVVVVEPHHGIPKRLHTDSNTYFVHLKWHHNNEESMKWHLSSFAAVPSSYHQFHV